MAANQQINPQGIIGWYKTNTHVTAGMVAAFVGQTGNEVTIAGADGATACTGIGFFIESVTGGRAVRIATSGTVMAVASGAIAAGDPLMVADGAGKVTKADLASAGQPIVGIAMSAAMNENDEIVVMPTPGNIT